MSFDIGVDFRVNNRPPRHIILTDWEARLVEHCLRRYLEAADSIEGEPTTHLAGSALGKVTRGPLPAFGDANERARARRRESKIVRELLDPTPTFGEVEARWGALALQLAEALEAVDPDALERISLSRGEGSDNITAAEWLPMRRAKMERLRAESGAA